MNNTLNNIGLCRRAGHLIFGFDAVVEAMRKDNARGVLSAVDISAKTLKEIRYHADKHNTEVIDLSVDMNDIAKITGKPTGILAVTDEGMFALFKQVK